MIMMKSVIWWRKPENPEETTDLRQLTDENFHTYGLCPVQGLNLGRSGVKQTMSACMVMSGECIVYGVVMVCVYGVLGVAWYSVYGVLGVAWFSVVCGIPSLNTANTTEPY